MILVLVSRHANQGDRIPSNAMMSSYIVCIFSSNIFFFKTTIFFHCLAKLEKLDRHPDGKFFHIVSLFSF